MSPESQSKDPHPQRCFRLENIGCYHASSVNIIKKKELPSLKNKTDKEH